eukprot:COSAG05_NODE_7852_length_763_cov_0.927711_2_plen_76_part_00
MRGTRRHADTQGASTSHRTFKEVMVAPRDLSAMRPAHKARSAALALETRIARVAEALRVERLQAYTVAIARVWLA